MNILFNNNAAGTLGGNIIAGDTTIPLTAGHGARFPAASSGSGTYFYATLIDLSNNIEIIKVTNRSTDTLTAVRGQDGTTARAYSTGDKIEQRLPNIAIQDIVAAAVAQAQSLTFGTISGNVTLTSADVRVTKNITAAADITLPAASALSTGDPIRFKSSTEQKVRLLAAGSDTIDGDAEYQIPSYTTCELAKSAAGAFVLTMKPNSFVGQVVPNTYVGNVPPRGFVFPDGTARSRTTYGGLYYANSLSGTITVTIASPGVVTWTGNKLQNNDPIEFSTSGALPTGIVAGTTYYVRDYGVDGANLFRLAATPGGTAINTSGTQSGTHTGLHLPYGRGDGSTTFNVVDIRGRSPMARDALGGTAASRVTAAVTGMNADTPGAGGGDQNIGLHAHGTTDPTHRHRGHKSTGTGKIGSGADGTTWASGFPPTTNSGYADTDNTGAAIIENSATGVTINNAGTGTAANLGPRVVTNWLVKT